jgi:RDD family
MPTPTAPTDPTRVVLRRCAAYTIDVVLIALSLVTVIWVTGDVRRVPNCDHIPPGRACFGYQSAALLVNSKALVWFGISLLAMIVLVIIVPQAIAGTSIGKALLGIRVVRRDGSPPGVVRSTVRLLCWGIDGLALLLPVALWSAIFSPGHRRVGDFAAGTFVVRHRAAGEPVRYSPVPWRADVPCDP